jgi:hypothetical protein
MTIKTIARCSIYEDRPKVCVDYPKVEHYIPPECTYYFSGAERQGSCACDEGACCAVPRQDGEPGGAPMPAVAGGKPCKYLEWKEENVKEASSLPIVHDLPSRSETIRKALGG